MMRSMFAAISGLKPDTQYYYGIYDAGKLLTPDDGSCTFSTLPEPGAGYWILPE